MAMYIIEANAFSDLKQEKHQEEEKKKKITSFGQPTSLIAHGRASATLPNVIHLCQTKCQQPPDRDALSTPYA
jgi:hypothetical protein